MKYQNLLDVFCKGSLVIFPFFILINDKIAGITFVLAFLLGSSYLLRRKKSTISFSRLELIFFISLSLLAICAVVSSVVNDSSVIKLDRLSIPMLAIPIYYLYRNNPVGEGVLWSGLVIGAVGAGITAIYQVLSNDISGRAGGVTNPIMFGDISLAMGFMSIAGSGWFVKNIRWGVIFPIIGFTFGLLASALSLSRGGWLALPVAIIIYLWFSTKKISLPGIILGLVLVILTVSLIYHTPQFKVKQRVETTWLNFSEYTQSKSADDPARNTSLGTRLEMWKTSWFIFQENPLFGVSWGSYRNWAEKYVVENRVSKNVARYPHPHNQYFSALAKGGLPGLASIILLFGCPLWIFYRSLVSHDTSPEVKRIALAGLVFLASFMAFALTEAVFERSRIMTFFAFYLTLLMALTLSPKNSKA